MDDLTFWYCVSPVQCNIGLTDGICCNHFATRDNHCSEYDVTRSKNVTVVELRESANLLLNGSAVSLYGKAEYRATPAHLRDEQRTNMTGVYGMRRKRLWGVSPKSCRCAYWGKTTQVWHMVYKEVEPECVVDISIGTIFDPLGPP